MDDLIPNFKQAGKNFVIGGDCQGGVTEVLAWQRLVILDCLVIEDGEIVVREAGLLTNGQFKSVVGLNRSVY